MRMCMCRSRAHARSLFFVWCTHVHKSPEILEYLKRIVATHKLLEPGAKGATAGKSIVRLSTEARWDGAARSAAYRRWWKAAAPLSSFCAGPACRRLVWGQSRRGVWVEASRGPKVKRSRS